jgi:fibronectin-binding autotransporter adhesin
LVFGGGAGSFTIGSNAGNTLFFDTANGTNSGNTYNSMDIGVGAGTYNGVAAVALTATSTQTMTIAAPITMLVPNGFLYFYNNSVTGSGTGSAVINVTGNISYAALSSSTGSASGVGTLDLYGSSGNLNTISGKISGEYYLVENNTNAVWELSNNSNSYQRTTTIDAGVLEITSIANGGTACSLGTASDYFPGGVAAAQPTIALGQNGPQVGTLDYLGPTASSNRAIDLGINLTTGDAGQSYNQGAIEVATSTSTLTLSGAIVTGATNPVTSTVYNSGLTLEGPGSGILTGGFGGNGASTGAGTANAIELTVASGTWTLNGSNMLVGDYAVVNSGATLNVAGGTALNTGSTNLTGTTTSLTINGGATLAGTGTTTTGSSNTYFTVTGSGTSTATRANVLAGYTTATPTVTTGSLTMLAVGTGSSTIGNANLSFNLDAATQGNGNTTTGHGTVTPGNSTQLNVGATNLSFASGTQSTELTLNLENSAIIAPFSEYVLVAGTGTTTFGTGTSAATATTTVAGSQYSGIYTYLNSLGQEEIANSGNLGTGNLVLSLSTAAATYYGANSYLFVVDSGGVDDIDVEVVPEPNTWALMLGGLGFLLIWQRQRARSSAR